MGRRPRVAALTAAVLTGIGFIAAEAIVLGAHIRDYDEGVYWQSFRALARGETLFRSIFAPTPPAFYYTLLPFYQVAPSLTSLRLGVLFFGVIGLAATYVTGRLLAGELAGLIALILAATSPLYLLQSAVLLADGPAVAMSVVAVALVLLALRSDGRTRDALALAAGLALAISAGIKLLGVLTAVPLLILLLGAPRARGRLILFTTLGGLIVCAAMLVPVLSAPSAAYDDLVHSHLGAGQAAAPGLGPNLKLLFLPRENPLEALAALAAIVALQRRDRRITGPLVWAAVSVVAILFYKPLFLHHLVMLTPPLALVAAVGLAPILTLRARGLAIAGLMLATAAAGTFIVVRETRQALGPDIHDAEMATAVRAVSRPGEFWISDNPYAVAVADRDLPGTLVDTSRQRTRAGLLTAADLEAGRVRYDVRWLLADSGRLDVVPGYREWRDAHFHAVESLGGGAVIYQANPPP
jgi:4-amino-4-deoxy-L-arabinose transferase-like glycosyltransferase